MRNRKQQVYICPPRSRGRPPRASTPDRAPVPARHSRAPCHPAARPPAPPRDPPAAPPRHSRAPLQPAARPPAPTRGPPAAPARHV
eukprot:scaffold131130_cov60-Phaeocystis_antarctica.AAC.2